MQSWPFSRKASWYPMMFGCCNRDRSPTSWIDAFLSAALISA
jgi:hypothetical protein